MCFAYPVDGDAGAEYDDRSPPSSLVGRCPETPRQLSSKLFVISRYDGGAQYGHPFECGKAGRGTNKYQQITSEIFKNSVLCLGAV